MREAVIARLQKRIRTLSSLLVKEYDTKLVAKFLEAEKELQIQKAYDQHENR